MNETMTSETTGSFHAVLLLVTGLTGKGSAARVVDALARVTGVTKVVVESTERLTPVLVRFEGAGMRNRLEQAVRTAGFGLAIA